MRGAGSFSRLHGAVFDLNGQSYYLLNGFIRNAQNESLVYDIDNGLWHRRYSPLGTERHITHVINHQLTDSNTNFHNICIAVLADSSSGNGVIYTLDPDGTNDAGASSQTTRTMTMPQLSYGVRTFMSELYLDMEKPSATGTITLSWSDDGGATYTSGITKDGSSARTRWHRLGSFYNRILRFTFSINSKLAIMGVRARLEVGV